MPNIKNVFIPLELITSELAHLGAGIRFWDFCSLVRGRDWKAVGRGRGSTVQRADYVAPEMEGFLSLNELGGC